MTDAYSNLKQQMALGAQIAHIKQVLAWDLAVNMPRGAERSRAKDLATLTGLIQEGMTNPEMKTWLELAAEEDLEPWDARNLECIADKYKHARMLPTELVRRRAESKARCHAEYRTAREKNDWKHIEPFLEESFRWYLDCSKIAGEQMGISPYDYQLRRYADGNSIALIDPLFNRLKTELPPLVNEIMQHQKPVQILPIHIDYDQQLRVAEKVVAAMGFDFNHGCLGKAISAFSAGWRQDARIATRFVPGTIKTIFSAIHEAGHAIYKQNLPEAWEGQPVGSDDDKSLHESQSLFFEKQIGFSRAGLEFIRGLLAYEDPIFGRAYTVSEFIDRMRQVKPSLVRIHADEATYPLHIVLRYEIERDLFEEKIRVRDIPELWREKTKEFFGLEVEDDLTGCLQDVHWFKGKFGYFPTYAQGAIYASQLFQAMKRDLPHADDLIRDGYMKPITLWLTEKVHRWGQFYDAPDLIERATGDKPCASFLLDHLKQRYLRTE